MSSLIFAHAKKLEKDRVKYYNDRLNIYAGIYKRDEAIALAKEDEERFVKLQEDEFHRILDRAQRLDDIYHERCGKRQHYFITVRPDERKCDFNDFVKIVHKYVQRKTVLSFKLSFEQKGTTVDNLGTGFHVHMVVHANWRSKGECLRDTQSSFAKVAAHNCVNVQTTKNPDDVVNKYLIAYDSDDGHKSCTKELDELWRDRIGIKHIIDNVEDIRIPPIKFGQGGSI